MPRFWKKRCSNAALVEELKGAFNFELDNSLRSERELLLERQRSRRLEQQLEQQRREMAAMKKYQRESNKRAHNLQVSFNQTTKDLAATQEEVSLLRHQNEIFRNYIPPSKHQEEMESQKKRFTLLTDALKASYGQVKVDNRNLEMRMKQTKKDLEMVQGQLLDKTKEVQNELQTSSDLRLEIGSLRKDLEGKISLIEELEVKYQEKVEMNLNLQSLNRSLQEKNLQISEEFVQFKQESSERELDMKEQLKRLTEEQFKNSQNMVKLTDDLMQEKSKSDTLQKKVRKTEDTIVEMLTEKMLALNEREQILKVSQEEKLAMTEEFSKSENKATETVRQLRAEIMDQRHSFQRELLIVKADADQREREMRDDLEKLEERCEELKHVKNSLMDEVEAHKHQESAKISHLESQLRDQKSLCENLLQQVKEKTAAGKSSKLQKPAADESALMIQQLEARNRLLELEMVQMKEGNQMEVDKTENRSQENMDRGEERHKISS